MEKEKKILVEIGEKKALGKLLGASYPTVRVALNGKSDTILLTKIRKAAIERGGMEIEMK
jgi:hypothetical protein